MAKIPTTNVTMETVRDTLANYGGTVSNSLSSFFTSAAKINIWSKHKPVVLAKDFCQDISSGKSNYDASWWQGANGMCGLNPKSVSSYKNIPTYMDGANNGWTYTLPTGGSSAPFRLGDFAGYNPDAYPLINGFSANPYTFVATSGQTVSFFCNLQSGGDYYQLSFADFPEFKNYYFGVYMKNGTSYKRATCATTIGEGGSSLSLSVSGLASGTWTAYPFFCSEKITESGSDVTANYWTVPTTSAITLTALASGVFASIVATNVSTNVISLTATVKSLGVAYSASNNYIYIRFASKNFSDAMATGEKRISLSSFSLSAGETKTLYSNSSLVVDGDIYDAGGTAWLSIGSGEYKASAPFGANI